ncbi:MAG TPA: site-specific DNA-methyltransferase [Elusimicrobiota bacterium]|nr:site-specific DNA-methyltransferase [Elusimicrobiota bacterium]
MRKYISPQISESTWKLLGESATYASPKSILHSGDALKVLRGLPDRCIHTSLSSPPYWNVRDYEHHEQLGLEETVDEYVEKIVAVYREVRRVLVKGGTAWLNVGDAYVGAVTKNAPKPWIRNKQLAMVPWRLAIALQEDGWWIRNSVVWHKPNAMPSSTRDRLTNTWEPVFLLTNDEQYYFNLDSIRVPHKTDDAVERKRAERGGTSGKAVGKPNLREWLNSPRHRVNIEGLKIVRRRPNEPQAIELAAYLRAAMENSGESIDSIAKKLKLPFERTRHYFRLDEIGSRLPPEEVWPQLKSILHLDDRFDEMMRIEVGDNVIRNHPLGRNPGDMMQVALNGGSQTHFATMPLNLASNLLKATLPSGGICLDPFMGSGTTGRAALNLGSRFVGIDVRFDYQSEFVSGVAKEAVSLVRERMKRYRAKKSKAVRVSAPVARSVSRHLGVA